MSTTRWSNISVGGARHDAAAVYYYLLMHNVDMVIQ